MPLCLEIRGSAGEAEAEEAPEGLPEEEKMDLTSEGWLWMAEQEWAARWVQAGDTVWADYSEKKQRGDGKTATARAGMQGGFREEPNMRSFPGRPAGPHRASKLSPWPSRARQESRWTSLAQGHMDSLAPCSEAALLHESTPLRTLEISLGNSGRDPPAEYFTVFS